MIKSKPWYAVTVAVLTVLVNALILQIFIWAGAPLSATSFVWVLVMAAFVSLLGGVHQLADRLQGEGEARHHHPRTQGCAGPGRGGAKAGAKKARARG